MPAKSKKQQRFFGMVHQCQKSGKCSSPEVEKVASSISYDDADDFASTKHKGLPEKKEEHHLFRSFKHWLESCDGSAKDAKLDLSKYDSKEVKAGCDVEREHDGKEGKDVDTVGPKKDLIKIVVAHLREDPKYYTKLKKAGL